VQVETLFFASYRDLVGESRATVDLPDGATVDELVKSLRDRGSPWDGLPADPAVAVNRSYVEGSELLSPGDEVAFIPPVAGG